MKKSELQQIIKEEISKSINEVSSDPQIMYNRLLDSYNEVDEWLTQNANTAQSVEIKRAFSVAFEKLQNILLRGKSSRGFRL